MEVKLGDIATPIFKMRMNDFSGRRSRLMLLISETHDIFRVWNVSGKRERWWDGMLGLLRT